MNNRANNAINPQHYNRLDPEPKDVIHKWGLNFNLGNAVKYVARAGYKDDVVQDLKKAQEYLQFEIDAIEAERAGKDPEAEREPKKYHIPENSPVEKVLNRIFDECFCNGECEHCTECEDGTEEDNEDPEIESFEDFLREVGVIPPDDVEIYAVEVPKGTAPEDVIKAFIEKIYTEG